MNAKTDTDNKSSVNLVQVVEKFVRTMKQLVIQARQPGFTIADWEPLAGFVAVEEFQRMGPFRDLKDSWEKYTELLTQWATTSEGWEPVVKRISASPGLVFLECEERITQGDRIHKFHSLSVYEFSEAGKIRRIDVYMQQAPQPG